MRSRRRAFSRAKRTTSWIAGVSSYDNGVAGLNTRSVTLTQAGFGGPTQWGAVIGLVANSDLPAHGGEGLVVQRIVGRLAFMSGRRNAGAGLGATGYQLRIAILQASQQSGGAIILADDVLSSAGMGKENIMYSRDTVVTGTAIGVIGAGYDLAVGTLTQWVDIDVRAKRVVTEDTPIELWFQTALAAGTTGADFQLLGGLRTLVKRPR